MITYFAHAVAKFIVPDWEDKVNPMPELGTMNFDTDLERYITINETIKKRHWK
jgi:hypothetical protein